MTRWLLAAVLSGCSFAPACSVSSARFTANDHGDDDSPADAAVPGDLTIRAFDSVALFGVTHDAEVIAMHDGDGAWHAIAGSRDGNGIYHVHADADHFGIAVVCSDSASVSPQVTILERTPSDGAIIDVWNCSPPPAIVAATGVVGGLGNDVAFVASLTTTVVADGSTGGTWTAMMPNGTTDLVIDRRDPTSNVSSSMIRRRDVEIAAGATFSADFTSEGLPVVTHVASAPVAGSVFTQLVTPSGTYVTLGAAPGFYASPPPELMRSGELVEVSWSNANLSSQRWTAGTDDIALVAPEPLSVAPPTLVTTGAYPEITWTLPDATTELPRITYYLSASSSTATMYRGWSVIASQRWMTTTHATTYTLPDLTAVPGFRADVNALVVADGITYAVGREESTERKDVDGGESRFAAQIDLVQP